MPYNDRNLSIVMQTPNGIAGAGRNGMTALYLYPTEDTLAQCLAAGYFNTARGRLAPGDIILLSHLITGTPALSSCVVTAVPAAPANVTVARELLV